MLFFHWIVAILMHYNCPVRVTEKDVAWFFCCKYIQRCIFLVKIGGCLYRKIATLNTYPKNQWVHIKKHTCVWFGMCPIAVQFIWQGHGNMIQYPRSVLPSAVLYGMTTILRASVAMEWPQLIFHRKQCRFKRKHSEWKYRLQSLCCWERKQKQQRIWWYLLFTFLRTNGKVEWTEPWKKSRTTRCFPSRNRSR